MQTGTLQAYYSAVHRNLKLSRDDKGVLVAEFHSDGVPGCRVRPAPNENAPLYHGARGFRSVFRCDDWEMRTLELLGVKR
jgi:hypothetical protein